MSPASCHASTFTGIVAALGFLNLIEATSSSCCRPGTVLTAEKKCERSSARFAKEQKCKAWLKGEGDDCCNAKLDCGSVLVASYEVISAKTDKDPERTLDSMEILCRQQLLDSAACSKVRTKLDASSFYEESKSIALACRHLGGPPTWDAKVKTGLQERARKGATTRQVMEDSIDRKWPVKDDKTTRTTTTVFVPLPENSPPVSSPGSDSATANSPRCCPADTIMLYDQTLSTGDGETTCGRSEVAATSKDFSDIACNRWLNTWKKTCCVATTTTTTHVSLDQSGCSPKALEKCKGNSPCIDLREGTLHHHLMWLNDDGSAHVDGEAREFNDDRSWTCNCVGTCSKLVGTWKCPRFYDGIIRITADYADDFTEARTTEFIDVCTTPPKAHTRGCCPIGTTILSSKAADPRGGETCGYLEDKYEGDGGCIAWRRNWAKDCCVERRRRLKSNEEDDDQATHVTIGTVALGGVFSIAGVLVCLAVNWYERKRIAIESYKACRGSVQKVDPFPDRIADAQS